jgi:hypothetical protein
MMVAVVVIFPFIDRRLPNELESAQIRPRPLDAPARPEFKCAEGCPEDHCCFGQERQVQENGAEHHACTT